MMTSLKEIPKRLQKTFLSLTETTIITGKPEGGKTRHFHYGRTCARSNIPSKHRGFFRFIRHLFLTVLSICTHETGKRKPWLKLKRACLNSVFWMRVSSSISPCSQKTAVWYRREQSGCCIISEMNRMMSNEETSIHFRCRKLITGWKIRRSLVYKTGLTAVSCEPEPAVLKAMREEMSIWGMFPSTRASGMNITAGADIIR